MVGADSPRGDYRLILAISIQNLMPHRRHTSAILALPASLIEWIVTSAGQIPFSSIQRAT